MLHLLILLQSHQHTPMHRQSVRHANLTCTRHPGTLWNSSHRSPSKILL